MRDGEMLMSVIAVVMAVVWILVPFTVFACRSLLASILAEQKRTNELLTHIGGYRIPPPQPEPQPWRGR